MNTIICVIRQIPKNKTWLTHVIYSTHLTWHPPPFSFLRLYSLLPSFPSASTPYSFLFPPPLLRIPFSFLRLYSLLPSFYSSQWMAVALDEEEEDEMSIESRSIGTVGEAPSYAFNVRIKVMHTHCDAV